MLQQLREHVITDTVSSESHLEVPVDGVEGQHSVPPHVRVLVLQAAPDGGHEGLQELRLTHFTQEPESGTTDKLVRVDQILDNYNFRN